MEEIFILSTSFLKCPCQTCSSHCGLQLILVTFCRLIMLELGQKHNDKNKPNTSEYKLCMEFGYQVTNLALDCNVFRTLYSYYSILWITNVVVASHIHRCYGRLDIAPNP